MALIAQVMFCRCESLREKFSACWVRKLVEHWGTYRISYISRVYLYTKSPSLHGIILEIGQWTVHQECLNCFGHTRVLTSSGLLYPVFRVMRMLAFGQKSAICIRNVKNRDFYTDFLRTTSRGLSGVLASCNPDKSTGSRSRTESAFPG